MSKNRDWLWVMLAGALGSFLVLVGLVVFPTPPATHKILAGGASEVEVEPTGPLPLMDLAAYEAQKPKGGARLEGICRLVQNSEGFYGLRLQAHEENWRGEFVFIEQDRPQARIIFEALKDGKEHLLTVEVRPVTYNTREGRTADGSRLIRIVSTEIDKHD
jgi:hypothetical protein